MIYDIIGGCAVTLAAVETDDVGSPLVVVFVAKDGSVGSHRDDVAIVLHSAHEDGFAQCGVHVAIMSAGSGDGIFSDVDGVGAALVAVVTVVLAGEPGRCHVVVLVDGIDRMGKSPRDAIAVADEDDFRMLGGDALAEHAVAVAVGAEPVVFVADFEEAEVEGCRVSEFGTPTSPRGSFGVAVAELYRVECILYVPFDVGVFPSVSHAHVDDIEGFAAEVFAQQQELHHAESVADGIAPVVVEVAGSFFDGADGFFPTEVVRLRMFGCPVAFDVASAGKPHEGGVEVGQHLCQVGAASVFTLLESGWKEADHVEVERSLLAVGEQDKSSAGGILRSLDFDGEFLPLVGHAADGCSANGCPAGILQFDTDDASEVGP